MGWIILSDENCGGHSSAIFHALARLGFADLLALELKTFEEVGLFQGTTDEEVWRFCQQHEYFLLTGNRTTKDGSQSLELVVRHLVTSTSLPVLTIGDLERILVDRWYCERCAERLAEIVFNIEDYRGVTRLYLS